MAYMVRLGLWGQNAVFPSFSLFLQAVNSGGVALMELVAMHLKHQGCYICRSLSYEGCQFHTISDSLREEDIATYDKATKLWQCLLRELQQGLEENSLVYPVRGEKKVRRSVAKKFVVDTDSDDSDDDDSASEGSDFFSDSTSDSETSSSEDFQHSNTSSLVVRKSAHAKGIVMRYFWATHQVCRDLTKHFYSPDNAIMQI
jgi:hypothetical protein